jgi:polyisoprenoid-binding protein YceI
MTPFATKLTLAFAGLVFVCGAAWAEPERYYVPPTQFNAAFQIMNFGFANVFGLFQNATGGFLYDEGDKSISRVKLALDTTSMVIPNPTVQQEMTQLINPRAYPELSFAAATPATFKDGKAEVKGTITVHGVSKPFTFEATLNQVGKTPHGGFWGGEGQAIGLSLRGSFKRADFGMADPPEEPGQFGDTVQLLLELQAMRQ